jgi:hypothetical protein
MLTFQTSGMVLGVLQLCETVLLQSRDSNFFYLTVPAFHFDADPDPIFQFDVDLDPTYSLL